MIALNNISKFYGKTEVISNFSLKIYKGNKIALMGSNGSGKSTILKIILGLIKPSSGEVIKEKINIGYASQNSRSLYMRLTANDNLLFFSSLYSNKNRSEIQSCIDKYAHLLKIENLLSKKMFDLSAGQIQKIIFLRSIVNEPDLILFDEAFINIDEDSKSVFTKFLENYLDSNQSIIWVTHDTREASQICNKKIYI